MHLRLSTWLLIALMLMLISAWPTGSHGRSWGCRTSGALAVLVIAMTTLLTAG